MFVKNQLYLIDLCHFRNYNKNISIFCFLNIDNKILRGGE